MLTMSTSPNPTLLNFRDPAFGIWADVASLYRDAMQASTQQLLLSSTRIIQEQTLRALISASQSCTDALAKNALSV